MNRRPLIRVGAAHRTIAKADLVCMALQVGMQPLRLVGANRKCAMCVGVRANAGEASERRRRACAGNAQANRCRNNNKKSFHERRLARIAKVRNPPPAVVERVRFLAVRSRPQQMSGSGRDANDGKRPIAGSRACRLATYQRSVVHFVSLRRQFCS
jgi:hypothetical protein